MGRYCPSCSHPIQSHDRICKDCDAVLLGDQEARDAQARWDQLPAPMKKDMEAEFARRCSEWTQHRDFYEKKSVWKHLVAGAIVFGVAGLASGYLAAAYAAAGIVGGKILNRRKGGIFLGTLVGAAIFALVLAVRTILLVFLKIETEAFLMSAALSLQADRIAGLVCPAAGGVLGYLIEHEFEVRG